MLRRRRPNCGRRPCGMPRRRLSAIEAGGPWARTARCRHPARMTRRVRVRSAPPSRRAQCGRRDASAPPPSPRQARIPARASSQPASSVRRSGNRRANRPATRRYDLEPVGQTWRRSAVLLRTQASVSPRRPGLPQRRFPAAVAGAVDGLGIAEVREDLRRRLGDDVSALASRRFPRSACIFHAGYGDPSWWEVLAGALRLALFGVCATFPHDPRLIAEITTFSVRRITTNNRRKACPSARCSLAKGRNRCDPKHPLWQLRPWLP